MPAICARLLVEGPGKCMWLEDGIRVIRADSLRAVGRLALKHDCSRSLCLCDGIWFWMPQAFSCSKGIAHTASLYFSRSLSANRGMTFSLPGA